MIVKSRKSKIGFDLNLNLATTTTPDNPNMAPVPSVCVRVPHSPSLDSGDDPGSPTKDTSHTTTTFRYHLETPATSTEFATLAVRECAIQMHEIWYFSPSRLN